ncbi:hypothetical protein L1987_35834 [Smallanthus sonchifolius]|uniref:Uncharacterized protein n=1 Tax=Smallanthus sonchifolius TaxID=185202 RepID=A0ACB9HD32_9ASTR|nr:hypothetical protein L1987_35834 [Smallanthus sonchifolius]
MSGKMRRDPGYQKFFSNLMESFWTLAARSLTSLSDPWLRGKEQPEEESPVFAPTWDETPEKEDRGEHTLPFVSIWGEDTGPGENTSEDNLRSNRLLLLKRILRSSSRFSDGILFSSSSWLDRGIVFRSVFFRIRIFLPR